MTALENARKRLLDPTPLNTDCGRLCACACCRSLDGDETGMLLFPGEEALYAGKPGWTMKPSAGGTLLLCPGHCEREERPLSCRLFPLLPLLREDGIRVAVDARARAVCPLAAQGKRAMSPDFVRSVREAGELLAQDEIQREQLCRLTAIHDELKALQRSFMGGND